MIFELHRPVHSARTATTAGGVRNGVPDCGYSWQTVRPMNEHAGRRVGTAGPHRRRRSECVAAMRRRRARSRRLRDAGSVPTGERGDRARAPRAARPRSSSTCILPGATGYEICRELKRRARRASLPIVFVTGERNEPRTGSRASSSAGTTTSSSRSDPDELIARVRRLVATRSVSAPEPSPGERAARPDAARARGARTPRPGPQPARDRRPSCSSARRPSARTSSASSRSSTSTAGPQAVALAYRERLLEPV